MSSETTRILATYKVHKSRYFGNGHSFVLWFEIYCVPPTSSSNISPLLLNPPSLYRFLLSRNSIQNLNFPKNVKHPHLESLLTKSWMSWETPLELVLRRRKFRTSFPKNFRIPRGAVTRVGGKFPLAYFRRLATTSKGAGASSRKFAKATRPLRGGGVRSCSNSYAFVFVTHR